MNYSSCQLRGGDVGNGSEEFFCPVRLCKMYIPVQEGLNLFDIFLACVYLCTSFLILCRLLYCETVSLVFLKGSSQEGKDIAT